MPVIRMPMPSERDRAVGIGDFEAFDRGVGRHAVKRHGQFERIVERGRDGIEDRVER
jgi:hypothetical protein